MGNVHQPTASDKNEIGNEGPSTEALLAAISNIVQAPYAAPESPGLRRKNSNPISSSKDKVSDRRTSGSREAVAQACAAAEAGAQEETIAVNAETDTEDNVDKKNQYCHSYLPRSLKSLPGDQ